MLFHIGKAKTSDEGNLTKNNTRKYFSAFSVEKFGCLLCIGGQEKNGKMARKKKRHPSVKSHGRKIGRVKLLYP